MNQRLPKADLLAAVAKLAELSCVFVVKYREPHRPLKIGIHREVIERGVLTENECAHVFRWYTARKQYQKALKQGGPRYDLDGNIAGEVTPAQIEAAKTALARIKARMKARDQKKRQSVNASISIGQAGTGGTCSIKAAAARCSGEQQGEAA